MFTFSNPLQNSKSFFLIVVVLSISLFALVSPEQAHALDFPALPGITDADDPITVIAKIGAYIILLVVFALFATMFVTAAYVMVTTLWRMIRDKDAAGELIIRLAGSLIVVVVSYWFLDQGESAAEALRDINFASVSHIERIVS